MSTIIKGRVVRGLWTVDSTNTDLQSSHPNRSDTKDFITLIITEVVIHRPVPWTDETDCCPPATEGEGGRGKMKEDVS